MPLPAAVTGLSFAMAENDESNCAGFTTTTVLLPEAAVVLDDLLLLSPQATSPIAAIASSTTTAERFTEPDILTPWVGMELDGNPLRRYPKSLLVIRQSGP